MKVCFFLKTKKLFEYFDRESRMLLQLDEYRNLHECRHILVVDHHRVNPADDVTKKKRQLQFGLRMQVISLEKNIKPMNKN